MYLFLMSNQGAFQCEGLVADIAFKLSFLREGVLLKHVSLKFVSDSKSPHKRFINLSLVFCTCTQRPLGLMIILESDHFLREQFSQ